MHPFVGRKPELAVLTSRLDEALSGNPQVLLIQGPSGIGKTTLLDEFVSSALLTGPDLVVIRASGEETESVLTYGVVDQICRSAADLRLPATVDTEPVAVAAAALRAELGRRREDRVGDPVLVGTLLLDLLDALDGNGLALVIDDAHWADRPSLQALTFALRRLVADRVLAALAVRDTDLLELPDSLHRVLNRPNSAVLRLTGMDETELSSLASALGVHGVGSAAVRLLHDGTQGNPLHARALLEEYPLSSWREGVDPLPPPRSFRRLVQDRYAACPPDVRDLVDAACVTVQCGPRIAAALAGVSDPFRALDEATRRDLLQVVETRSPWTLSFPHPLIRSAVYDAIGAARRHSWHLAAVELAADPAAALRHRVAAAAQPDEELAADLSRYAGTLAERLDWQGAASHLVTAGRLSPDPAAAQRRLMRAMVWTVLRGDAATARGFATEIAAFAGGPLRDLVLGAVAETSDEPATAARLLESAWRAVEHTEADPDLVAIIAVLIGIHHYGQLDGAATVRWCTTALSSTSHPSIRSVAETYLIHGLGYAGRSVDSYAVSESAQPRPDEASRLWLNPRSARGVLRLIDDDLDGARADLESAATTALQLGIQNTAAFSFAYLARAEWVAGEWDSALLHAERAVAINLESGFGFMESAVTGIAVLVPAGRGDWPTADAYIQSMSANENGYERSQIALGMSRARIGEARGQPAAVVAALQPVYRFAARDGAGEPGFWPWQDLYAEALVATGRADEADAFLVPHEQTAQRRGRRTMIARLARARGRIAAAQQRPDEADGSFQLAIEVLDGLHVPFELARIELTYGQFLRRAGRRRQAAELLESARGRFAGLGAGPYSERCDAELAASGLAGRSQLAGRDRAGLTGQELVVARLAAGGASNRTIADQLVVSIKTVEYHLRNVFGKLGVTSRHQLAERLGSLLT